MPLPTLRAMVQAAEAGATILPASPGFYHRPKEIRDLLGFVTQRILDHLGLPGSALGGGNVTLFCRPAMLR